MGRLIPFRRRGKRTRRTPPHWRGSNVRARRESWGEAMSAVRPMLLLIALVAVWLVWDKPALIGLPDLRATDPVEIDYRFPLCGPPDYPRSCVVDGDTVRIDGTRIRVLGIDTAETEARCAAEAERAERSTLALQEWLNRGPFTMQGRLGDNEDKYGRPLRTLWREGENGTRDEAATFMRTFGGARRNDGEARGDWC